MTKPRRKPKSPLLAYAAFVQGSPELRSIRETKSQAQMAGRLWNRGKELEIGTVTIKWGRK